MKKIILLLIAAAAFSADAQKAPVDSLQAMPMKLFSRGNILNCSVKGYGDKFYEFRFLFSGDNLPAKALLRRDITYQIGPAELDDDDFNKPWRLSGAAGAYLNDWVFGISPSRNVFVFNGWSEGINPGGNSNYYFSEIPGAGHFDIFKGLDTANYRQWKIFIGTRPMQYDMALVYSDAIAVNFTPATRQDVTGPAASVNIKVYEFSNSLAIMGIGQWGDLFFPLYYKYRKQIEYQYRISGIQVGF